LCKLNNVTVTNFLSAAMLLVSSIIIQTNFDDVNDDSNNNHNKNSKNNINNDNK
jgi:hypothetical protein